MVPSKTNGGAIRDDRIVLPIPPGVRWNDEMPIGLPATEETRELRKESHAPAALPTPPKRAKRSIAPRNTVKKNGVWFNIPAPKPAGTKPATTAIVKTPRAKTKADERLVAAARELRDRYLDEVNAGRCEPESRGKYDVSRSLATPTAIAPLLAA